jgi:hypothetical protein
MNTVQPKPAAVVCLVTLRDVKKACRAQKRYSAADRARKEAEDKKKASAMKVLEALLGVKTEDEVRALSPAELKRTARARIRAGLVLLKGIDADALLENIIQKSKSERRPSWKDCFIAVHGESKATEIQEATAETFSYRFVESALG